MVVVVVVMIEGKIEKMVVNLIEFLFNKKDKRFDYKKNNIEINFDRLCFVF